MRGRIPVVAGLAVVLAVVVAGSALHAQVPASVREKVLREARELARMGNHEAAIRRVEPLYERAPLDGKIVEGLARLLLEANRFERAEEILVAYTAKRSDDTRAVSTLASVHFKAGEKAAGMEILNRLVDGAPGELWPYQMGGGPDERGDRRFHSAGA
jgi:thioredoxin-like negative regulator of GroEL